MPVWVEDGVTVTGDLVGSWTHPDVAHIDACCTYLDSNLVFTTGSLFQPISLDIQPLGSG